MISKSAIIGEQSKLGKNVTVGNFSTIEDD